MIDSRKLRDCFGCFATGIAIATTTKDVTHYGLTINSFSSVSLDPPLILFSIERNASSFEAFCAADYFNITILSEKQDHLSRQFARSDHGKWEDVAYHLSRQFNNPVIEGGLAWLECKKEHMYEGGDHMIFVGRVMDFGIVHEDKELRPLLYYKGTYKVLGK